jgi:hypothetical protein
MPLLDRALRLAGTARRHSGALCIAASSLFLPPVVVFTGDQCLHTITHLI